MTDQAAFYRRAEEWLYRLMELNPVLATQLGDHRWDDQLGDNSPEAVESQYQEILAALDEFRAMDTPGFDLDTQIDHILVVQLLDSFVRRYERHQSHRRNPSGYLDEALGGVFLLLMKEFAPLPNRLRSALGRVREVPRVLAEAEQNIA